MSTAQANTPDSSEAGAGPNVAGRAAAPPAYRIFISSPGDVAREREVTARIIHRLRPEFADRILLQPFFWEYQPMSALRDYQEQIPLSSEFHLVICLLWSRLGSPLHIKHRRADGRPWQSGTEFEIETAAEAIRSGAALPQDLWVYLNRSAPPIVQRPKETRDEMIRQHDALEAFVDRWTKEEDQTFKAALTTYENLAEFEERLEAHLRNFLTKRFPPSGPPPPPEPTWAHPPYRGLQVFDYSHAPIFFGRTKAVDEVINLLRAQATEGRAFVVVLGMSGGGKSSLVRAGVLPMLTRPGVIEGVGLWRRVVFQPSQGEGDLFDRLAVALVSSPESGIGLPEIVAEGTTVSRLAERLRHSPLSAVETIRIGLVSAATAHLEQERDKIREWLQAGLRDGRAADVARYQSMLASLPRREARLALVVDQLEELFTVDELQRDPAMGLRFVEALDSLAREGQSADAPIGQSKVFVIATLRSDFFARCQSDLPLLTPSRLSGHYTLHPPDTAEIGQIITKPAFAAGLEFERDPSTEQSLDVRLRDEVRDEPGMLPLLEFALEQLDQRREPGNRCLTFRAYQDLGGQIATALANPAQETLGKLQQSGAISPQQGKPLLSRVMRQLATSVNNDVDGTPIFNRLTADYGQLTDEQKIPGAKFLIDAFVAARLFIADQDAHGRPTVRVAHEALLTRWPLLVDLLREDQEFLQTRARLSADRAVWEAKNREAGYLLPEGPRLAEAEKLLGRDAKDLSVGESDYIERSIDRLWERAKQRLRRVQIAAALLFLLSLISLAAGGFAFWEWQASAEQALNVRRTFSRADYLRAMDFVEGAGRREAMALLGRAIKTDPNNFLAVNYAVSFLLNDTWPVPVGAPLPGESFFTEDRKTVVSVTGDEIVRRDPDSLQPIGLPLPLLGASVEAIGADGHRVLLAFNGNFARFWNTVTGLPIGDAFISIPGLSKQHLLRTDSRPRFFGRIVEAF